MKSKKENLRSYCVRVIVATAGALLLSETYAAGFYLAEVGTPHSLGTAGVANPTNIQSADAAWSNPAGMAFVQQDQPVLNRCKWTYRILQGR